MISKKQTEIKNGATYHAIRRWVNGLSLMVVFTLAILATASWGGIVLGASTCMFDFSTGDPALIPGQNTPLNQSSGGIIATFTSPSDPDAFSVQNYGTTFFVLSEFSGNFIYDNKPLRNTLEIRFNQSITAISLVFATLEYHGGPGDNPTNLTLTAYTNSTLSTPIGSATAHGEWPSGSTYPQGTLSYSSNGEPFNIVRIALTGNGMAADFLVDNVTATLGTPSPSPSDSANASVFQTTATVGVVVIAIAAVIIFAKKFAVRGKAP